MTRPDASVSRPDLPPGPSAEPPRDLFDRHRRALRRGRRIGPRGDYLGQVMAEMLIERIDDITRPFATAAVIGARSPMLCAMLLARGIKVTQYEAHPGLAARTGAVCADEDRLPFEPESQDLIVWPGGLESVNDVPGALLRCRLALKPDGVVIGCFIGDGSFPALRAAMTAASDGGRVVARMHPQIDLRGIGDVLMRVGLTLPVVDIERVALNYRALGDLVADLRAGALTAVLAGPVHALSRTEWAGAQQVFGALADASDGGQSRIDARTTETVRIVHFSGWAPDPSQPQPARRGSATASLAAALGKTPPGRSASDDGEVRR